jgi:hypothetical protein
LLLGGLGMALDWISGIGKYTKVSIVSAAVALLLSCGNGVVIGSSPPPTGLRLYVGGEGSAGHVNVIPLPLTSASYEVATISAGAGMAFDASQRLFVAGGFATAGMNRVCAFTQPIGNFASPAFCVATPFIAEDVKFDSAGNMFVSGIRCCGGGMGRIAKFTPPITAASVPAFVITTGIVADAIAVNPHGDLFVGSRGYAGWLLEFAQPIAANSTGTLISPGISMPVFDQAGHMYAVTSNGITFYQSLFTPVFTIKNSPPNVYGLVLDGKGDLYVAAGGALWMYAPPISALSKPAVTIATSAFGGLAIGP